jgi:hypothetical protein
LKMKLKGLHFADVSRNWWIKDGKKRGIFGSFSENVRPRKNLYICQWNWFWTKKSYVSSLCVLGFLKKSVLKRFDRIVYTHTYIHIYIHIYVHHSCFLRTRIANVRAYKPASSLTVRLSHGIARNLQMWLYLVHDIAQLWTLT